MPAPDLFNILRTKTLESYCLEDISHSAFDDIANLAKDLFQASYVLITIVDQNREWILANHGSLALSEKLVFCDYCLVDPSQTLISEDIRVDDRFSGNAFVRSNPSICFYAHAPIIDPSGVPLGFLSVFDHTYHPSNAEKVPMLTLLSKQITTILELHKTKVELSKSYEDNRLHKDELSRVQAALSKSEAHFSLLSNTVPAMIFYLDSDQRYQFCNQTFMQWFGVTKKEVIGKTVKEFLGDLVYSKVSPHLSVAYNGEQETYDLKSPTRMGTERWLSIVYTPHISESGEVTGVIVLSTDITQSKQSEHALRESESRFRALIEEAPVATSLFVGREMNVVVANETMLRYWGKDSSVVGLPLAKAVPELRGQPFLQILDSVYQTGETYSSEQASAEVEIDGILSTYYFNFTYKPLKDVNGKVFAVMDMAVDVTEQVLARKKLEESESRYRLLSADLEQQVTFRTKQLLESVEELERSNQNLLQFAYVASHDLQEPLRKIQTFGQMLKSSLENKSVSEVNLIDRMQSAAARMSMLIRDVLAYSQVSTKLDIYHPVPLDLVIKSVEGDLELLIEENHAQLIVEPLPVVMGNEFQLGQLFQNFINNAIKFHRPGILPKVQIRSQVVAVSKVPEHVKPAKVVSEYLLVEIEDNGIGFDEVYKDRIFTVFQRLHGKTEFSGTGIGLAICEKVVNNHGGAISVASQIGKGTTFGIYFPMS